MHRHFFLRRTVVLGAVAAASLLAIGPARAQLRGALATPAEQPAPSSPMPAAPHSAACTVATDQVRFDFPLPRTARLLASGLPIKIVALGSSSTYGVGASTSSASYPSRLAEELVRRFPGHKFTVLNRGVSGEDVSNMLAGLDTAVIRKSLISCSGKLAPIQCWKTKPCSRTPRCCARDSRALGRRAPTSC